MAFDKLNTTERLTGNASILIWRIAQIIVYLILGIWTKQSLNGTEELQTQISDLRSDIKVAAVQISRVENISNTNDQRQDGEHSVLRKELNELRNFVYYDKPPSGRYEEK